MDDAPQGDGTGTVWALPNVEYVRLVDALHRARRVVKELNYRRRSDDIERARAGAEHELETALELLGQPVERVSGKLLPRAEPPAEQLPLA